MDKRLTQKAAPEMAYEDIISLPVGGGTQRKRYRLMLQLFIQVKQQAADTTLLWLAKMASGAC